MHGDDIEDLNESQRCLVQKVESNGHQLVWPFLRRHGQFFNPQPLPKGIGRGTIKHCYGNAYRMLTRHGRRLGLSYAEGYATTTTSNLHLHAWAIDKQGKVYDPTWKVGSAYFGVALRTEFVMREIKKRETSGDLYFGFLDDWERDFPLIKQLGNFPDVWKQILDELKN